MDGTLDLVLTSTLTCQETSTTETRRLNMFPRSSDASEIIHRRLRRGGPQGRILSTLVGIACVSSAATFKLEHGTLHSRRAVSTMPFPILMFAPECAEHHRFRRTSKATIVHCGQPGHRRCEMRRHRKRRSGRRHTLYLVLTLRLPPCSRLPRLPSRLLLSQIARRIMTACARRVHVT